MSPTMKRKSTRPELRARRDGISIRPMVAKAIGAQVKSSGISRNALAERLADKMSRTRIYEMIEDERGTSSDIVLDALGLCVVPVTAIALSERETLRRAGFVIGKEFKP